MRGIVSYGVYVPYWRLQRSAITGTLGSGGGRGTRSVAGYDEDTTSMGAEAGRIALRQAPEGYVPSTLWFATTAPAYLDKTNANGVHAALALPATTGAYDVVGAVRSNVGACTGADRTGGLAILSDVRIGLPGGADEANGGDGAGARALRRGDGAAALAFGEGEAVIAESIGGGTATAEFLDRWRVPGDVASKQWEERFGEHVYVPLAEQAVNDALKSAGLTAGDIDHLIVTGLHARAAKAVAKNVGARPEAQGDDLSSSMGNPGTAQAGVLLADVLDRAQPNQVIALVQLADGCDVW